MGEQIKRLRAKVAHKYETEANWNLSNYIPDVGEIVFYDKDDMYDYVRQKNGDGIHTVKDLPFIATEDYVRKQVPRIALTDDGRGNVSINMIMEGEQ